MPLYEYKCDNCGDVFETMQKFSDAPLTLHEKCGGSVHRMLSAPALQFKGSGWYVTDYAKSGGTPTQNGSEAKPDSAAPAKTESGSSSSSGESSATPAPSPASSEKSSSKSDSH